MKHKSKFLLLFQAEEKTMKRYKTNQQASQSSSKTYPDHVNHTSFTLHERIFPEWPVCQSSMLTPRDFQRVEAIRVAFEKRIELGLYTEYDQTDIFLFLFQPLIVVFHGIHPHMQQIFLNI
jgi:hypothetical protein